MTGIGAVYLPTAVVPEWQRRAACGGRAGLMDPPTPTAATIRVGRIICWGCPVFRDCQTWMAGLTGSADPGGMLAAVTHEERTGRSADSKLCRGCLTARPIEAFTRTSVASGATRSRCRACEAARPRTSAKTPQQTEVAA